MPSFKVVNQSDARPWHLQERLPSDGRWRVLVFPGDLTDAVALSRYTALGEQLSKATSFLKRFTPVSALADSVIDVLTVHCAPRWEIELCELPEVFHPFHGERLGWDYWKVFADDDSYHEGHGQCYDNLGLDKKRGAVVILRPDQYVSWVGEMEDYEEMDGFFTKFMIPKQVN